MTTAEIQAILCPVNDDHVVLVHRLKDTSLIERLGGMMLDDVLSKLSSTSPAGSKTRARLFTTTPEIERLLDAQSTYSAKSAPGHFLPVVLDDQGHYLRQMPLKEADPSLLVSASTVNPAVLAAVVATQIILRRLQVMEALIQEMRADVSELIDRWDSQQRAKLRAMLLDLGELGSLVGTTEVEWGIVQGYREGLMTLHGEFVEEIKRLGGQLMAHSSLTHAWASLTPKQAERLAVLIQLEALLIRAIEAWTAMYLLHRPVNTTTEEATRRALDRVFTLKEEAAKAILTVPADALPTKPELTTVLRIGPIRANRKLEKARENQQSTSSAMPSSIQSIQASGEPLPLKITGEPSHIPSTHESDAMP